MRERRVVIGLGAGGHAKVLVDALRAAGGVDLAGLLDPDPARAGAEVLGVPVLGSDALLPELREKGVTGFFVALGSTGDAGPRRRLYERGLRAGLEPVRVVHPRAAVSPDAEIGPGAAVLAGAVVNAGSRIGADAIVNSGAVVEHDCALADHVHVATGACLAGGVRAGEACHVGAGAVVLQGVTLGARAVVGAGAVVLRDVADGQTVVGVPARPCGADG